jgi:hypothetical protein
MARREIKRQIAAYALALALLPAGLLRAGANTATATGNDSGSVATGIIANPRSVDAAAMANVPCYFEGSSILQADLAAGPSRAQDPAQAASAQRINVAMDEECTASPFCGASIGFGGGFGATVSSGRRGGFSNGLNTYGNGGW